MRILTIAIAASLFLLPAVPAAWACGAHQASAQAVSTDLSAAAKKKAVKKAAKKKVAKKKAKKPKVEYMRAVPVK